MTPLELGQTYRSTDGQWEGVLTLFMDAGQQVGRFERADGLAVYCHASNVLPVVDDEALSAQEVADRINRGDLAGVGLSGMAVDTATARVNDAGQVVVDMAPAMFYGDGRRGP